MFGKLIGAKVAGMGGYRCNLCLPVDRCYLSNPLQLYFITKFYQLCQPPIFPARIPSPNRQLMLKSKVEMQKKYSAVTKEGNRVEWNHAGGKFRRLGPSSCSEKELLAIILGQGTRGKTAEEIATDILNKYHSLYGLMDVTLKELMFTKGLKEVKATQVAAVFEIANRIVKYLEKE